MSMIQIEHLSFCYDGSYDMIFEDVSFQIDTDWKLGFTGRNGRGKTTFLNLLLGKYEYLGSIAADVKFDYFPFEITDRTAMTSDLIEEIGSEIELWRVNREMNLLGLDESLLYRPYETLSNGEQTKVMLAVLFAQEGHFLLIDEPTNHLDAAARNSVSEYLNKKKGFILVSHDRMFLDRCVDHILSINKTNIEIQKGNFSSWQRNKERQDNYELAENEKLKRDISRLTAAAKRTSEWSDNAERKKTGIDILKVDVKKGYAPKQAAKAKKMMKRAKAIEERQLSAIEEKARLLKNIETTDRLLIRPLAYHAERLAEVKNLSIFYGETQVFETVSFAVRRGDRIALTGKNGSGKTSIIKLLLGQPVPHTGIMTVDSGVKISYVSQDTSFLRGELSAFAAEAQIDESRFKTILRKLDFSRTQFDKRMEEFSEGQKKKTLIARSLCEQAHLYLWDEPLNFVDVLSRIQIEELILNCQPTMVFVEHDVSFAEKVATQTIVL